MQVYISTYKVRFGSNIDKGRGDSDWFLHQGGDYRQVSADDRRRNDVFSLLDCRNFLSLGVGIDEHNHE